MEDIGRVLGKDIRMEASPALPDYVIPGREEARGVATRGNFCRDPCPHQSQHTCVEEMPGVWGEEG